MRDHYDVLIVGAGHGGAHAALALRQRKFTGSIAVLSDEACLPYERPPLSKDYLSGKKGFEQILLRSKSVWENQQIDILLAERAVEINALQHTVKLLSDRALGYGALVWAAGGRARRLSCAGADLEGVYTIRSCSDVDRLRAELGVANRIVIVGAGYIGLEAAASLVSMGKKVCVIESQSRVLERVTGPDISQFIAQEHRSKGVEIRLQSGIQGLQGARGRVAGVELLDGSAIAADAVIVGIGILPNVESLATAGAEVGNGVHVDAQCRTTLPDVFAIGDCARHPNRFSLAGTARLESVQNAVGQAATVARVIMGEAVEYSELPWFWSEQFDLRLQTAGISSGFDQCVLRGDPAGRSFSVVYLHGGRVIALDCVNAGRDFTQGKLLVSRGVIADPVQLADTGQELRALSLS